MNKVQFAALCAKLQTALGTTLGVFQIRDLLAVVDDAFEGALDEAKNEWISFSGATKVYTDAEALERFATAIAGDRKIEAIKEFRSLTGWGLKESKDAVERALSTPAW